MEDKNMILKICENVDGVITNIDTTLYIFYNHYESSYVVKGKRTDTKKTKMVDYSFECYSTNAVLDFIECVTDIYNNFFSYTLFMHYNIPSDYDKFQLITHNDLNKYATRENEISAWDNGCYNRNMFRKYIRSIKNMYYS